MSDCKHDGYLHDWYAFDSNAETVWWRCANKDCSAEKTTRQPVTIPEAVTRIDIVGSKSQRLGEFWADEWDVYVQDEGRTIKFFAKGDGGKAHSERNASLGKELEEGYRKLGHRALSDLARQRGEVVEDWHGKATS